MTENPKLRFRVCVGKTWHNKNQLNNRLPKPVNVVNICTAFSDPPEVFKITAEIR